MERSLPEEGVSFYTYSDCNNDNLVPGKKYVHCHKHTEASTIVALGFNDWKQMTETDCFVIRMQGADL